MNKYLITFTKQGYIKYTSHLDMVRLFKRNFKRAGIDLVYSHGFNPHPNMTFGQPLSLGYESTCELLEFETTKFYEPLQILNGLKEIMPKGIEIVSCELLNEKMKSIASTCYEATYLIKIPVETKIDNIHEILHNFLLQKEIIATKSSKKHRELIETDIKPKIRSLTAELDDNIIIMSTRLDAGSASNLSPELLIDTFCKFNRLLTDRATIDVVRTELKYL